MSRITRIKAVSFDLDGTLWDDFDTVMRRSLAAALEELAAHDSAAASSLNVEQMITVRERVARESEARGWSFERIRLEAFRQTLLGVGRPSEELARRMGDAYFRSRFGGVELHDDVLPTLDALRHRYQIGAVSNGNSYPDRMGLEGAFGFVVLAQDHGFSKPDPRIFAIAAKQAGCERHELLHVGDDLQDDVEGAMGAGVRYVWINRKGLPRPRAFAAECEIINLTQLLDMLVD